MFLKRKSYLVLTNRNRKIVVLAESYKAAKLILEGNTNEKSRNIRRLKIIDLVDANDHLLVLPNKEYI